MARALILVDLQRDFLAATGLEPSAGQVLAGAAAALAEARARGDVIAHVRTSVDRDDDRRMAHWRALGRWLCERGTPGHAFADEVAPRDGELVVDKTGFSGFLGTELHGELARRGVDAVAIGGVHLHACVRATALDAYQLGYDTMVLEHAVGSDDPLHAASTRRYLEARAIHCGDEPHAPHRLQLDPRWPTLSPEVRAARLDALAERLDADGEGLARVIVASLGKPITLARGEVARSAALARAAARQVRAQAWSVAAGPGSRVVYRPLGAVLALTPYNNPVAIPIGKLAPALGFGNTVVWKPAPLGHAVAEALFERVADLFDGGLVLVSGGSRRARELMADPAIDAVTLSGSNASGHAAAEICARRRIPLQAELGGNNGAIVWRDADLAAAARAVAEGAFGFAGQRCTANRRVIVDDAVRDAFVPLLIEAMRALPFDDPWHEATRVGPLVSALHADRVRAVIARARAAGLEVVSADAATHRDHGAWVPPTIVVADAAAHEIVQEETFGPVLVVQPAASWEAALTALNGVRQGLVAACFTPDAGRRADFLARAEAGILKLDRSTADADAEAPFGGVKSSGLGPPEHGPGNAAFYLRMQAVYAG